MNIPRIARLLTVAWLAAVPVLPFTAAADVKPRLIRFGYGLAEDSNQGRAARFFAEEVGRLSDGRLRVRTFGGASLGTDIQMQNNRSVVMGFDGGDCCREFLLPGLANPGRGRHGQNAIAGGDHLAGQDHAGGGLILAERIFDVIAAEIIGAVFRITLAGAAHAVGTVHRQIDLAAECCVEDLFPCLAFDEASDPILEIQRNSVAGHEPSSSM